MKTYTYHDVNFRGTITQVFYNTTNAQGESREKYANVYLPYGYDPGDKQRKYNILYLMHGGGGNPDAWLDCCKIKNMLDYCFDSKEAEPFIVVFPSYYKEKVGRVGKPDAAYERDCVMRFQHELAAELIPAVESRFNGYAEDTSPEGLKAPRNHRAFGGFSMGGATTWFALLQNLDYIATFLPLSGDCWILQPRGGAECPSETVKAMYDTLKASGYGPDDFRIFSATGTKDPAYSALKPQFEEMKKYPDLFRCSDSFTQGNFHYFFAPDYVHAYEQVYDYLYTYLPFLF